MIKYIIKRTILILLTLFLILSITFFLLRLLPIHPPLDIMMENPAYWAELQARYGFDRPLLVQYFLWLEGIFTRWDWGFSTRRADRTAFDFLWARLPVTMQINMVSFLIAMPLGFIFGIWAALRKNKFSDHVISVAVMIFISVPSFVVITFLVFIFAVQVNWLPIVWTQVGFTNLETLRFVIPIAALSFGPIASLTRFTRAELTEVLTSEYLLLARTKGLNKRQTVLRHAMRNSMIPLIGIVVGNFIGILSGSLVIEQIYSVPGVGQELIMSINERDLNVTIAVLAFYTVISLFAILFVDISYGIIDPRVRIGRKKS